MVFKAQRNSNVFGRLAASVKHWAMGQIACESRVSSHRPQEETKCPGAYALLVGIDRR